VVKLVLSAIGIHSQAFDKKLQQKTILYPNIDIKSLGQMNDKMDYHLILLIQHLHL
jgi:hypothetical protein